MIILGHFSVPRLPIYLVLRVLSVCSLLTKVLPTWYCHSFLHSESEYLERLEFVLLSCQTVLSSSSLDLNICYQKLHLKVYLNGAYHDIDYKLIKILSTNSDTYQNCCIFKFFANMFQHLAYQLNGFCPWA